MKKEGKKEAEEEDVEEEEEEDKFLYPTMSHQHKTTNLWLA